MESVATSIFDSTKLHRESMTINPTNHQSNYSLSIYLFLAILCVYITFSPSHLLTTPDEELNLRTTLSLMEGQRGAIPPLRGGFASKRGIDGKEYAQYGLGLPILSVPWCTIGTIIDPSEDTQFNSLEHVTTETQTGTLFLRWWMTVFSMILTALTIVMWESIFRRVGLKTSSSIFFALLLAFCTYMWPHGRTFFTEPAATFCLTGAVWSFFNDRTNPNVNKWIFFAGMFWAYALLVRIDTGCTAPAALWLLFTEQRNGKLHLRWNLREFILFSIPFAAVILTIALYNQYRFDSFISTGYEDQAEKIRFATPLLVGLHGFLFTPGRSLFVYSPPLIFAAWGVIRLWRRDPWLTEGVVLICVCYLAAMSKWQNWAGGYDWGPRHIYQTTPFLLFLSAGFFFNRTLFDSIAKRVGWCLLILLSVFVQFLGLAMDAVFVIKEMVYNASQTFGNMALMQFMIYLPQFSSPVLHWRAIQKYGADLYIVQFGQLNPFLLIVFLIPVGLATICFYRLFKFLSESG